MGKLASFEKFWSIGKEGGMTKDANFAKGVMRSHVSHMTWINLVE